MLKHTSRLILIALGAAWAFDLLFWKKLPGVSFPLFVMLCLIGGFVLAWGESLRPAPTSLLLLLPIGSFAAMAFLRLEPFTVFINYALTLSLMALLTITFLGGRWMKYGLVDYLYGYLRLIGSALSRGAIYSAEPRQKEDTSQESTPNHKGGWKRALPVLRGLAIALPILVILAALLASADLVFFRYMKDFLAFFRIEKLPEYLLRGLIILILAYLLIGIYLHALTSSDDKKLIGLDKPLVPRVLGLTETAIILGGVDLLFALFVFIQFRYFFGGQANINIEGFTYAEYARRGFAELVVVALFSLALFLGLSTIARRDTPHQRRIFSGLGLALVFLLTIILASAFQRLLLYEEAYGFSRLRTYTHVFMIWIGVLLLALAAVELVGRLRYFWLAALLAALGFGLTLNLLNVDRAIARQNISRAQAGKELDTQYLMSLSLDAAPTLIDLRSSPSLSAELKDSLGGILACQNFRLTSDPRKTAWQSFHLGRRRAMQALEDYQEELIPYPVRADNYGRWVVTIRNQDYYCYTSW